ncbi:MAG: flavodoxin family protein [Candidatus Omnitrophota bacterium]
MKQIAVVFYSRTGNTEAMARIIADEVNKASDIKAEVFNVEGFPADKALEYDGLIVGSPTYYGAMAYQIKEFFDDSVRFHGSLRGKVGGAFSSAANVGGGNETTIMGILGAMLIHGMVVQGTEKGDHFGPVAIDKPDARAEDGCRALGKRVVDLVNKLA